MAEMLKRMRGLTAKRAELLRARRAQLEEQPRRKSRQKR
jgi:hypothetical protein